MAVHVVLGAASGMGRAVACRLSRRRGRLVLADVDVAGAEQLAAELGGTVDVQRCDVSDRGEVETLAQACGEFETLVVTAGLSPSMASGRRIFAVDIVGPALVLEAFAPLASSGSVAVVLASMAGHMLPLPPEVEAVLDRPLSPSLLDDLVAAGFAVDDPGMAYMCSKRAVQRLVQRSAKAWGDRGARVLSVSPGIIDTPMGRLEDEAQPVMADLVAGSALGRMIDADEVAAVVEFLVSPAASAMTGTDVLVDGGVVAQLQG